MSRRLQVVMSDSELAAYERRAKAQGMTLSEWVRGALRSSNRAEPKRSPDRKLAAIRAAARHRFPAPDIDQMLSEVLQGRSELPE